MTGLRTDTDSIIEIATVVTDAQLQGAGRRSGVRHPDRRMRCWPAWTNGTRASMAPAGWSQRIRASDVTLAQAEARTLEFLRQWVPGGTSPMCGNSICQDRRFLARQMPQLERYFHYRNLDVSTREGTGAPLGAAACAGNSPSRRRTWRWPTSTIPSASCSSTASGCSWTQQRRQASAHGRDLVTCLHAARAVACKRLAAGFAGARGRGASWR